MLKGKRYNFKGSNCQNYFDLPSDKRSSPKKNEFAARGSKLFPFTADFFSERFNMQESNQGGPSCSKLTMSLVNYRKKL